MSNHTYEFEALFYKRLGNELLAMREMHGRSQDFIARQIGVTNQQYHKYERGIARMPLHRFILLTKYYKVSPMVFLDGLV